MEKKYKISGMSCAACQAHVDKAIRKLDCVSDCNVNLLTNSATVQFKGEAEDKLVQKAVKDAGYEVILEDNLKQKNRDYNLRNIIISFSLLFILMYISMGHMFHFPLPSFMHNPIIFASSQLVLTIPICIIYRKYFISGYKKLFRLTPNMDSLVALSATASIIYGIYAITMIIIGSIKGDNALVDSYYHNLYFESAAMILTLVSFGKFLESLSKKRTLDAITNLVSLIPNDITIKKDGKEELVSVKDAHVGDVAVFRQGDVLACDGKIVKGGGSLNEANITGEAIPLYKSLGEKVYASSTLNNGYIEVEISKELEDNSISQIISLVTDASSSKAPISRFADKVSLYFVPIVLGISLLSFIIFLLSTHDFSLSFNILCSVLVVACPCSLGLATPVAIMVGIGKGAKNNMLIKNAEILELAHKINCVAFDKTGTVTRGYPEVYKAYSFDEEAGMIAKSLESLSNHPLSNAINNYLNDQVLEVKDFQNIDGQGINGLINEKRYYLGNEKYLNNVLKNNKHQELLEEGYQEGATVLILFDEEDILSIYYIKDQIRESSSIAIELLQKEKIEVILLTGDNEKVANSVGKEAGINKVIANVLPNEKSEVINSLKGKDKVVAMVGDGVNDSVALTTADIGIAIGSGSEIATKCADIILQRNDLLDLYNVIKLSKRTYRTIKINLFWAFFYNLIGIVFASGLLYPINHELLLNPMICSILMSFSSVFVVLNALTINRFKVYKEEKKMDKLVINVNGMMCMNCARHVKEACLSVSGVVEAEVSLENKNVTVSGVNLDAEKIKDAIRRAGYEA